MIKFYKAHFLLLTIPREISEIFFFSFFLIRIKIAEIYNFTDTFVIPQDRKIRRK